ncbi:MAG: hypothetical protein ACXV74_00330 [Methylobacter sp.]
MTDVFFRGYGYWIEVSQCYDSEEYDVDQLTPNQEAYGVFSLCPSDEMTYRHTQSFDGVTQLMLSTHPDRHLTGLWHMLCKPYDEENCYFRIDTSKPMTMVLAKPYEPTQAKTILTETERNTMLKLIIGMAIDAYGYDLTSNRNSLTGDKNGLSAKLQRQGINISDDTIRKYLNQAKNLL